MRLAIVHDYLIQMGGAERVVAAMAEAFPRAPIYTSVTDQKGLLPELLGKDIRNSFMNLVPGVHRHFKKLFPIYPFAFRSLPRVDGDVVWISSSGFSKWIRATESAKIVCYCHTPPRFFWSNDVYLEHELRGVILKKTAAAFLRVLREQDYRCAQRIHQFVANSQCVRERIREYYGRDSIVIHPPVNVDRFSITREPGDYYLVLARLVGYKRIDLAIKAFNQLREKLIIVGDGPDRARLETIAGPTITFVGRRSDEEITNYLQGCRALIFPGLEDFGIAPVEAQACGRPVIAFAGGGALETIVPGETGLLFETQAPDSLVEAVRQSKVVSWSAERIRANALSFDREAFLDKMRATLRSVCEEEFVNSVEAARNGEARRKSYGLSSIREH
jgi:glycosyltransferase involved in cell wall biosynthesis